MQAPTPWRQELSTVGRSVRVQKCCLHSMASGSGFEPRVERAVHGKGPDWRQQDFSLVQFSWKCTKSNLDRFSTESQTSLRVSLDPTVSSLRTKLHIVF